MQFDNSAPIWVQLVSEFARRIVVGDWASGARLPGVRELAAELGVNPNTAQRALAELERQGLCRSERTAGRFVTDDPARIDQARAELVGDAADAFVRRARGLKMGQNQAQELIQKRWNRYDDHDRLETETGGA
ncbi:MAG TPA: GntR family transcriptional regulator [Beutenbergiaceae bacterium]|nr:GntR family transcriptional regulator [Beutenbergiaceae bacterium]